jgi:uncharacterized protein
MQYRRFGQTDWPLSVLSLGTMRCLADESTAVATIVAGLVAGINHLETAQGYGESEIYLGRALQQCDADQAKIYVTTKIPPLSDATQMTAAIDRSLSRLQLDYIDGLAIHGINTPEHLDLVLDPAMQSAIDAAVAAGKIRQVGFSTHGPLAVILAAIASGRFAFVNLHYGLLFQRNGLAIAAAAAQDMGIFIISPADKAGMLYTPPDRLVELCDPLSPLEANYQFLWDDPRITTLSVGPAHPTELQLPLSLVESRSSSSSLVLENLDRAQEERLGTDRCHQCYACLPCPVEINIPEVLRLRNLAIAYDMQAFGEYRYGMFEQAGHWFPGNKGNSCNDCGDCLPRCPHELPIPGLLRDTHDRLNGKPRRRLWED